MAQTRLRLVLIILTAFSFLYFTRISVFKTQDKVQGAENSPAAPYGKSATQTSAKSIRRRVVAVADLHGDLEHALSVFRMAGLLPPYPSVSTDWIGGHDILVSTGDIVDRGDDTIKLYQLFQKMRKESQAAGGRVVNLVGNHEVMNALGDWRYVTQGDIESFGGRTARRAAMSSTGWIGKDWLENYNVTARVPLLPPQHPSLPSGYSPPSASFVHGGITSRYAGIGIDEINRVGRSLLRKGLEDPEPSGRYPHGVTRDEMDLWSEDGPLWYRGYAYNDNDAACKEAHEATQSLGVKHLVMGHTPHFKGFVVRCPSSEILLIDTGISRAYGGEQSALIIDTELTRMMASDGEKAPQEGQIKWRETEVLTALYKGRRPKVIDRLERTLWL
ncbi:Metallo-dependent phosphatase [Violaceomyces palustris]|uniref:Metallo-dependent phosphatase n=1 Tax=Violaceomyces palustris TaxID=1673888 RepID=A0ACD0P1X4_9BASI|nr:Metallo-dependent phosphatase [Violaceomyces palustris]